MAENGGDDWQTGCVNIKDRRKHLLNTGYLSDCVFTVGGGYDAEDIVGHKTIMAMASPTFENMLFDENLSYNNHYKIQFVEPKIFIEMKKHIYIDEVDIQSYDMAYELCEAAEKYKLPFLMNQCLEYMDEHTTVDTYFKTYEISKAFGNRRIAQNTLQKIRDNTKAALASKSFYFVELRTILELLDQDELNIDNELDLFNAIEAYDIANMTVTHLVKTPFPSEWVKDAMKKIRFLTLSPKDFLLGPGISNFMPKAHSFAVLKRLASPATDVELPKDFSTSTKARNIKYKPMLYCTRQIQEKKICFENRSKMSFSVNKNIYLYGLQIPTERGTLAEYHEEEIEINLFCFNTLKNLIRFYATTPTTETFHQYEFKSPCYIEKDQVYLITVITNSMRGLYVIPDDSGPDTVETSEVNFTFALGKQYDSHPGLVRTLLYKI